MLFYRVLLLCLLSLLPISSLDQSNAEKQQGKVANSAPESVRFFLPLVTTNNLSAASDPDHFVYRDINDGFTFEYPIQYEQSPMREAGCALTAQTLNQGGLFFSQSGDRLLTFGNDIHLTIRPAHGLTLDAYVEQFIQQLQEQTTYGGRDDQRFNREPRGYVLYASVAHHSTAFVLFSHDDQLYIFFVRFSLASSNDQIDLHMEETFWHAAESFRTGFGN